MPALMDEMMLSTWTRNEKFNNSDVNFGAAYHSGYDYTSDLGNGFPKANRTAYYILQNVKLTIVATTIHLVLVMAPAIAKPPDRNQATEDAMA